MLWITGPATVVASTVTQPPFLSNPILTSRSMHQEACQDLSRTNYCMCLENVLIYTKFRGRCWKFYLLGKKRKEMTTKKARCRMRVRWGGRLRKMLNSDNCINNEEKPHSNPWGRFEQLHYLQISSDWPALSESLVCDFCEKAPTDTRMLSLQTQYNFSAQLISLVLSQSQPVCVYSAVSLRQQKLQL